MPLDVVAALVPAAERAATVVHLVRGPYLTVQGRRRELPEGARRLVVLVALSGRRLARRALAGAMWPDCDDRRAGGNLRSALWRLHTAGVELLTADPATVRLRPDVLVDVLLANAWAARMIDGRPRPADLADLTWQARAFDLLPGWDDDAVVLERERLRQRMLHGLEAMSRLLVRDGRCADAVSAARVAVAVDPLRESAQRVLAEAHLAAGDRVAARRGVECYRAELDAVLGVAPRADLLALGAAP